MGKRSSGRAKFLFYVLSKCLMKTRNKLYNCFVDYNQTIEKKQYIFLYEFLASIDLFGKHTRR